MSDIRELSFDEIALVSGGNANSNYEGGRSYSEGNNRGSGSNGGGAPATTANNAGIGAIVSTGMAIAAGAGPVGVVAAAIGGAVLSSLPSTSGSSSNNQGGGNWHDTNPGGMVGECRW